MNVVIIVSRRKSGYTFSRYSGDNVEAMPREGDETMAKKKKKSNSKQILMIVLLLVMATGAVVVFQSGFFGRSNQPVYDSSLVDCVTVTGTIRADDLNLSGKEITRINRLMSKFSLSFDSIEVNLELEDQFAPIEIENDTVLVLRLRCQAPEMEVAFWSRKVPRNRLVKHMETAVPEAAKELKWATQKSGNTVRRIYL